MSGIFSKLLTPLRRRVAASASAGLLAAAAVVASAGVPAASAGTAPAPAVHARQHVIHPAGKGHAKAARRIDFRKRAAQWQATQKKHAAGPPHRRDAHVSPFAANTTAFDGISEDPNFIDEDGRPCAFCGSQPSVATSADGAQILEAAGNSIQVFNKAGTTLCGKMTLDAFFGQPDVHNLALDTADAQYDDTVGQFIVTAAARGPGSAIYIAATTGHDACGSWNVFRLQLSSGPYTPTSFIDLLHAGLDSRALLFSADIVDDPNLAENWAFLAVPKAAIYAGTPLTALSFIPPDDVTAMPVSAAGSPIVTSPVSYFLSNFLGPYTLYTMNGTDTPNPTLTFVRLGQTYPDDSAEGGGTDFLERSPVFDGTRIWFAHQIGDVFQPNVAAAVRYGYISVADDSMRLGQITGSANGISETSPSIAVSPNPDGTDSVFLDWDNSMFAQNPMTAMVKSFIYPGSGPLPGSASSDQAIATSPGLGDTEVNYISAAAADPGTANGPCAVTAQDYFPAAHTWTTRIRRKCGPLPPAQIPPVTGDTQATAVSAVQAAGFTAAVRDVTTVGGGCNAATTGTIFAQSPTPGPVSAGAAVTVTLSLCDLIVVPDVTGDTPAEASTAIQQAGLTVGATGLATSCDIPIGHIIRTIPPADAIVSRGTTVGLIKSRAMSPDC